MPLPVRSLPVLQNWDCHGCTDCCREFRVQVTADEKSRIDGQNWDADPDMKGVKVFARDGGFLSGQYRLNQLADSTCVFLDPKGGCRIHAKFGSEAKPLACRIYPFVLVPFGDHWRISLRFACPSATNDQGRPIAAHDRELREFAAALEKRERFAERSLSAPMLQWAQTVPWSDLAILIRAFLGIVQDERRPLEWRLRHMLAVINLCRQSRFDKITGDRLKEFLSVIGDGVSPDVPAHPEAVGPPGWVGRILFRQIMAIYARKDSGPDRGISRRGRAALLWAAMKFAQGVGTVPRLHALIPETTFEKIENSTGPLSTAASKMLTRYYQVKLASGQFFGPTNFRRQFWDGLESLILTFPAIMWLGRALHDRPKDEAIALALRMTDDNFGFNPLLGSQRQLFGARVLAGRGELGKLVAWYGR
jgi:lysine-N-methylase